MTPETTIDPLRLRAREFSLYGMTAPELKGVLRRLEQVQDDFPPSEVRVRFAASLLSNVQDDGLREADRKGLNLARYALRESLSLSSQERSAAAERLSEAQRLTRDGHHEQEEWSAMAQQLADVCRELREVKQELYAYQEALRSFPLCAPPKPFDSDGVEWKERVKDWWNNEARPVVVKGLVQVWADRFLPKIPEGSQP